MPVSCPECGDRVGNRALLPGHYRRKHREKLPRELAKVSYREAREMLVEVREQKRLPGPLTAEIVEFVPKEARRVPKLLTFGDSEPEWFRAEFPQDAAAARWSERDEDNRDFYRTQHEVKTESRRVEQEQKHSDAERKREPVSFERFVRFAVSNWIVFVIVAIVLIFAGRKLGWFAGARSMPNDTTTGYRNPWESSYEPGGAE